MSLGDSLKHAASWQVDAVSVDSTRLRSAFRQPPHEGGCNQSGRDDVMRRLLGLLLGHKFVPPTRILNTEMQECSRCRAARSVEASRRSWF